MTLPDRAARHVCGLVIALAVLLLANACTDAAPPPDLADEEQATTNSAPPRSYRAEWLINAEAVGADTDGTPFFYIEVVDDATGQYYVQTPQHLAMQRPDEVVLCAAIFRLDPFCASAPRADGTPNVLSFPIQVLRSWGPSQLFDLAGYREVALVANSDEQAWSRRTDVLPGDIAVECFTVIGETTAAAEGFDICFTDDELHLVATVDLQSDLVFEIDMVAYTRRVEPDDFVTGLEDIVEARPLLLEQLIDLFPEIPAPRPTPTPGPAEPDAG